MLVAHFAVPLTDGVQASSQPRTSTKVSYKTRTPQWPLALADLIGLDTVKAVAESLYEELKEPLYSPPPLLARMVSANLLGRKTGRGFYTYDH